MESGDMFGILSIKIKEDKSENKASQLVFESVDTEDYGAYEDLFPAAQFFVLAIDAPSSLRIENLGQFEWDGEDLLFKCYAEWEIGADESDFEAWGKEFASLWDNTLIELEHKGHPGLYFEGYFSETPEYN